ncbi:MAG: hypothetical protein JSS60_04080 [Verrucomicrobia bacterium]|nr:hypothetical protein [Verrucomicrobiota bacterium]
MSAINGVGLSSSFPGSSLISTDSLDDDNDAVLSSDRECQSSGATKRFRIDTASISAASRSGFIPIHQIEQNALQTKSVKRRWESTSPENDAADSTADGTPSRASKRIRSLAHPPISPEKAPTRLNLIGRVQVNSGLGRLVVQKLHSDRASMRYLDLFSEDVLKKEATLNDEKKMAYSKRSGEYYQQSRNADQARLLANALILQQGSCDPIETMRRNRSKSGEL